MHHHAARRCTVEADVCEFRKTSLLVALDDIVLSFAVPWMGINTGFVILMFQYRFAVSRWVAGCCSRWTVNDAGFVILRFSWCSTYNIMSGFVMLYHSVCSPLDRRDIGEPPLGGTRGGVRGRDIGVAGGGGVMSPEVGSGGSPVSPVPSRGSTRGGWGCAMAPTALSARLSCAGGHPSAGRRPRPGGSRGTVAVDSEPQRRTLKDGPGRGAG